VTGCANWPRAILRETMGVRAAGGEREWSLRGGVGAGAVAAGAVGGRRAARSAEGGPMCGLVGLLDPAGSSGADLGVVGCTMPTASCTGTR